MVNEYVLYAERNYPPPVRGLRLSEIIDPVNSNNPASITIKCFLNATCSADIDVGEGPTVWVNEEGRVPGSFLDVMVPQRHDKVLCFDASTPSLRIVGSRYCEEVAAITYSLFPDLQDVL